MTHIKTGKSQSSSQKTLNIKNQWDSGLKVKESIRILIKQKVQAICQSIQNEFPDKEFSILVKGEFRDSKFLVIPDFVIPKQEVSGASVDFKEDLQKYKDKGYNTVIHSHPRGIDSFSTSDDETINTNFRASILFSKSGSFEDGKIPIRVNKDLTVLIDAKPEIDQELPEIETKNISEKIHQSNYSNLAKRQQFINSEYGYQGNWEEHGYRQEKSEQEQDREELTADDYMRKYQRYNEYKKDKRYDY